MIDKGYEKPRFFVRIDEKSPQPVSQYHEKLYKDNKKHEQWLAKNQKKKNEEELKDCTFAPILYKSKFSKKYARSPRPINEPIFKEEIQENKKD